MDQENDLKAFERRMIEIISSLQPITWRWRITLFILVLFTLATFYNLITDILFTLSLSTSTSSVDTTSIANDMNTNQSYFSAKEISFSISFCLLLFAFFYGIHRKIFTSSIIISRFRSILADYNMSCDINGRFNY